MSTLRSREYTPHAVRSLLETTLIRSEDRVVIVNNDDPSILPLPYHPKLEIVHNSVPLGFAENANLMIDAAVRGGFDLYLLNNDIIFSSNWLLPLARHENAIVLPICNQDIQYAGTVVTPSAGQVNSMLMLGPSMHLESYLEAPYLFQAIADAHRRQVEGYKGFVASPYFCVKIPLSVIERVGKFDTRFGKAGGEDYDYSLRAWLAGFPTERSLQSLVLHFWGRSTWNASTATAHVTEYDPTYDRSFVHVFKDKWGELVYKLVMNTDQSVLATHPEAHEALSALDIPRLLRTLNAKEVAIKIS
jgi:GT2 family glycosyltransferase